MALQTLLQYTESNLVGYLESSITTTSTDIYVRFYDSVDGSAREPLATTLLFVIEKGTSSQHNPNYEIILADSHTTTNGVTHLADCTRGLSFSGVSLAGGTGKNHTARVEVGTVDVHYLTSVLVATLKGVGDQPLFKIYASDVARDSDVTAAAGMYCFITATATLWYYDGTRWCPATTTPAYANASARDVAITSPRNGMSVYNTADGTVDYYIAGSWVAQGTSTTPNASTSAAGKAQQSTDAENVLGTVTGSSGAPLFVNPSAFSVTANTSKAPIASASTSRLSRTWLSSVPYVEAIAGENLAAGDPVYIKQSDGKFYKALNTSAEAAMVVGAIITAATTDTVAYAQTAGVVTVSGASFTAGSSVYLGGTAGLTTPTAPSLVSGSIWPVCLGRALSSTTYEFSFARLQRYLDFTQTIEVATSSYNLAVGFPIGRVVCTYGQYYPNATTFFTYTGYYEPTASTYGGNSVSNAFIQIIGASNAAAGTNYYYYIPSVSGTNLVLTRATAGTGAGTATIQPAFFQVYELL